MNHNDTLVVYYGMKLRKKNNRYFCNGAFGRYIDEMASRYEKIFLVMPTFCLEDDEIIDEYQIESDNIIFQEIIGYTGYIDALKKSKTIKKQIREFSESWEGVVYTRWPVPLFNYVYKISKRKGIHQCYHLVGDPGSVVSEGNKYVGIQRLIAINYANYITRRLRKIIKDVPALVNGSGLKNLYSKTDKIIEIRTSTFRKSEITLNVKELHKDSINILYVGYLRHEKGLTYLLESIEYLIKRGYNLRLSIIGEGDIMEDLIRYAKKLSISDHVEFKGYIPLGEKLFEEYYKNDLFVLPSISEGTPRVLIEAMSKGLPVIATCVGGIPFTVKDGENGILVGPKDSMLLAKAIMKVINDDQFRNHIVNNGIEFAKQNTIESHVDEVVKFVNRTKNSKKVENH